MRSSFYEELLAASPDHMYVFDRDGVCLYASPAAARALGMELRTVIGKTWRDLDFRPEIMEPFDRQREMVMATGKPCTSETIFHSAAGLLKFEYTLSRIVNADHGNAAVVCITRDVTERYRAELAVRRHQAQIEALNARLHRAVYESSHRIKNHLQVLSAMVAVAAPEGRKMVHADEFTRLGIQIRTLSAIHDLITLETKTDADIRDLSVKSLLEKLLSLLKQALGNARIRYFIEDATLSLQHATSLAMVVNEMVGNALKYGREVVEITFHVEADAGILAVCDDGPGFPAGFDALAVAHTGLELIESGRLDLCGDVRYENAPQGGARVVLTFPLTTADTAPLRASSP